MAAAEPRRAGRRPGDSGTREAIVASARELFAAKGYDGASLRAIAGGAGVDPALISHYFGSKSGLFQAAVQLPVDLAERAGQVLDGTTTDELPGRIVATFLDIWESPDTGPGMIALMRGAVADEQQASLVRSFMAQAVLEQAATRLTARLAPARGLDPAGPEAAALLAETRERLGVAMSQLLGAMLARHVIGLEPLASLDRDRLAARLTVAVAATLSPPADREKNA